MYTCNRILHYYLTWVASDPIAFMENVQLFLLKLELESTGVYESIANK